MQIEQTSISHLSTSKSRLASEIRFTYSPLNRETRFQHWQQPGINLARAKLWCCGSEMCFIYYYAKRDRAQVPRKTGSPLGGSPTSKEFEYVTMNFIASTGRLFKINDRTHHPTRDLLCVLSHRRVCVVRVCAANLALSVHYCAPPSIIYCGSLLVRAYMYVDNPCACGTMRKVNHKARKI